VGDESSVLDEPVDHAQDIIALWDDWGGWDHYKVVWKLTHKSHD
jgi:hypothetical protein